MPLLEEIHMKRESKSYIDSLYVILTAADLFSGPKYMLSGLSGMAFKFAVHEQLLHLSVTAYGQWGDEHGPAIANLGLYTEWDGGRTRHPTFSYYQQEAIKAVKQSIDQGVGVIYWLPEFGVIQGYDDEDSIFYVQDGWSEERKIVLYDNFGLNFTPFWYWQTFRDKVILDFEYQVLESLRLAIQDWVTPHKTLPNTDIGSGKLAYTFLIQALQQGEYDEGGAVYILDSYMYSREEIACYLREVQGTFSELKIASSQYDELLLVIAGINRCITNIAGNRQVDRMRISELCTLLQEAQSLEDQAISQFQAISSRFPDLKRSTIPRWGSHSPR
ncbi:hypothetical protein Back11_42100 [Paenibacillus baekrokdamisoli]|uniref:Uncharacterized protein n=1 Tax=Paenibacillus baekrokdamisoli TaxID=1712516 RepID=A0A3G9J3D2_9BACL|nr:hypothetical protein [Paenibacillus baekrokdamisoli]MBB3068091.1 hypothetical protein [Paenibacillus baekrokdamisoli]BBH22865.1 hypothetical protein Back11_42100 [Paenibacillus baekrokdamisoli]